MSLFEKGIKLKLSGNEDYYAACSLLVMLQNSCSKLHDQKVLIYLPFHKRADLVAEVGVDRDIRAHRDRDLADRREGQARRVVFPPEVLPLAVNPSEAELGP